MGHCLEACWVQFYFKRVVCVRDSRICSDVPCLELPCISYITASAEILQEREPQDSDAGEEVTHTYSFIFQPPIHKVWMLLVPLLPDDTVH
jgi:hypothetical protein